MSNRVPWSASNPANKVAWGADSTSNRTLFTKEGVGSFHLLLITGGKILLKSGGSLLGITTANSNKVAWAPENI